jgi:hypothetical protein
MEEKTIFEQYAAMTYVEAQTRLAQRFNTVNGTLPSLTDIKVRRAFDSDDHWQLGEGFIGALPTGDEATERTDLLKKAFSPEDVISEVLDTHVQNVLGNDPAISLEDEKGEAIEESEILDIVKEWWFEKRKNTDVLADALRGARRESARVLRAFIPSGMVDGEGRIQAKDLREALSKIWIRSENIESGGVIVDESTATELGLFSYRMRIDQADVSLTEYAFIDEQGRTVWGTASAHTQNAGSEVAEPFLLNGLLPIYQLNAKPLITNSVCQAQRSINLSGTMLTRNNNLAGSRERLALGVQPPGEWTESNDNGVITKTFVPAEMPTGPATFNFLQPEAIRDDNGKITAFANPNVIFTDPVQIDTFIGTSSHWRRIIYAKAKMLHLLMSDDATASGKSRVEARKEFQSSLEESKLLADAAGSWMVEVAMHIAAHFIGSPGKFLGVRAKFESEISTIELTPEEITQIRDDYKSGMIDLRTALELRGLKNVDEILERVEAKPKPVTIVPPGEPPMLESGVAN